ncbi:aminoacyl-tRNA hydrolase [Humidisolicoccus flavus]|uniref:aminoacyl-tRNA hydrolase n=1 Tax=Humidisolicoccus flavus TaxID=3111414 RepID=UPI003243B6C3
MADVWLVVGLGNPGPDYVLTRHNVGVLALDVLGDRAGVQRTRNKKANALVAEQRVIGGPKVVFAEPLSFMNRSGGPVSALMDWFNVPLEQVIVIHDDLDLEPGAIKLKLGGGHGGHNGLRDIIAARGADFLRVRVGIGRPVGRQDAAQFVLGRFSATEREALPESLDRAADAVELIIRDGLLAAQQVIHAPQS